MLTFGRNIYPELESLALDDRPTLKELLAPAPKGREGVEKYPLLVRLAIRCRQDSSTFAAVWKQHRQYISTDMLEHRTGFQPVPIIWYLMNAAIQGDIGTQNIIEDILDLHPEILDQEFRGQKPTTHTHSIDALLKIRPSEWGTKIQKRMLERDREMEANVFIQPETQAVEASTNVWDFLLQEEAPPQELSELGTGLAPVLTPARDLAATNPSAGQGAQAAEEVGFVAFFRNMFKRK